jgi:hypothetical protein
MRAGLQAHTFQRVVHWQFQDLNLLLGASRSACCLRMHSRARTWACRPTDAHAPGSDLIVWGNEGHPKVKARRRPPPTPHGPIRQASARPSAPCRVGLCRCTPLPAPPHRFACLHRIASHRVAQVSLHLHDVEREVRYSSHYSAAAPGRVRIASHRIASHRSRASAARREPSRR